MVEFLNELVLKPSDFKCSGFYLENKMLSADTPGYFVGLWDVLWLANRDDRARRLHVFSRD